MISLRYGWSDKRLHLKFILSLYFPFFFPDGPSSSITLEPPQTRYDIGVGSSLEVSCSAVCDPDCSYSWVKDDGTTVASSGNLRIASISATDGGVYVCRAANDVGPPASASIIVNVLCKAFVK